MILSGVSLLDRTPQPARDEIRHALNGNICRCGTYQRIVEAVEQAGGKGGGR
jgi:aerobic-type carbon monoxide dehydrogenase small subunit (CoxS/CutS family)